MVSETGPKTKPFWRTLVQNSKANNVALLCICLLGRGATTRIDRQIDDTSLLLMVQRSRVPGERLHLDRASVVHFIKLLSHFAPAAQVMPSEQVLELI
ncbi:uncharacterized protein N7500_004962 [Penicillium coprophilum]|uniref:uncharacterized protein n=1 Tax=Penicillium coprophilum TaxID=36646 RepID=UPI00239C93CE|nr:uncharacterized protein N7500_004962 [Penicillium coprophilum]KAJ5163132.1 hypothetical protein N7500_004962 [Penicillium coprophilum]